MFYGTITIITLDSKILHSRTLNICEFPKPLPYYRRCLFTHFLLLSGKYEGLGCCTCRHVEWGEREGTNYALGLGVSKTCEVVRSDVFYSCCRLILGQLTGTGTAGRTLTFSPLVKVA